MDVEVSEVDINRIQAGQEVTLNFDAVLAKKYHGEIIEKGLVGNTMRGAVTFQVTVELLDADVDVHPGMTAGVNIVVSQLEDVILFSNRVVRVQEGRRVVNVLCDDSPLPEPGPIVLGASSETHSEVVDGELNEGDQIVLNPPSDFTFFGQQGGGR